MQEIVRMDRQCQPVSFIRRYSRHRRSSSLHRLDKLGNPRLTRISAVHTLLSERVQPAIR
jgi:hypothetical protein